MFGGGQPDWAKGGDTSNQSSGNSAGGLSNRFNSYQQGPGSNLPPAQEYAENQSNLVHDTLRNQYVAEGTAASVMNQMQQQRQQIQGAHDDLWQTREAAELAKREIADIAAKNRRKKQKLYKIIAVLGFTDLLLFWRIISCHGSFFC